ncbi:dihydrolipoyltranssuccinase [Buchnera aphidicola (Nipponaphis monzeni)]|uniref:Dihydrolipoyllysine-residue succinyltransferase n=1 Tax=Buchnera aphidicola (Nipponaphis monzeni) TaxID=2495405 RepID=A0A455TA73_9GAMM|nr:dihydrolipoyllysine-residue succinyltransferase [Buchnera aphidicola]BBI01247.1 dihydrolipoyltranssuccinase [Buchnera aphidicola (Nipponaphis monzeni)]
MNKDIVHIYAPELPESTINATVINWYKKKGEQVYCDEILVDIETDKIVLEVSATSNGILDKILKKKGEKILSKELLGIIHLIKNSNEINNKLLIENKKNNSTLIKNRIFSPKLRRFTKHEKLKINKVMQESDINHISVFVPNQCTDKKKINDSNKYLPIKQKDNTRTINRVPMSQLRKCISKRLVAATNNMAMLTTFNEVNMQSIIQLKKKYSDVFEKTHSIKLGLTSFFVKAVVEALKIFPKMNASIDGEEIIYYNYFDISIAMSTNRGLVTPVLKNVDFMNICDIEKEIKSFKLKANNKKLLIDDLTGGNFTITNGGIFGSLFSTPIINPPQTAILGLHTIQNRPIAINKNDMRILPMMYLALSYDHRLIDGEDAIKFLKKIKEIIEDYSRIILNV